MPYTISEDGKYCYKVSKDGKKTRVSKEEYLKKTKTNTKDLKKITKDPKKNIIKSSKKKSEKDLKKKKIMRKKRMKGGNFEELLSWGIIVSKTGNLSPTLQQKLVGFGFSEKAFDTLVSDNYELEDNKFVVIDYDTSNFEEVILNICGVNENSKEQTEYNKRKGVIVFISNDEDSTPFEICKNEETFKRYKQDQNKPVTLKTAQEKLWNSNFKAPISLYDKIKNFSNITYVYISSIYVFTGTGENLQRPEVILDYENELDFVSIHENNSNIEELFKKEGNNIFAYGKRFVELQLNDLIASAEVAPPKVIILRMDAITDENTKNIDSAVFLKTLKTYNPSTNLITLDQETRYPVTSAQVADVLITAINVPQDEFIKVYHIAGTEKETGLTKTDMIEAILNVKKPKKQDRKMDDTNSMTILPNYAGEKRFLDILNELFTNIPPKDTVPNQQQAPPVEEQVAVINPTYGGKIKLHKAFSKIRISEKSSKKYVV